MDPSRFIEDIGRSLGFVPAAILAIVLLAGPTVAWLLYRFVVQPRTSRYPRRSSDPFWICEDCRSANDLRSDRCYACGLDREDMGGAIQVVDDSEIVTLPGEAPTPPVPVPSAAVDERPLVAVGPGRAPEPPTRPDPEPEPDTEPAPEPVPIDRSTPPRRHATSGARGRSRAAPSPEE